MFLRALCNSWAPLTVMRVSISLFSQWRVQGTDEVTRAHEVINRITIHGLQHQVKTSCFYVMQHWKKFLQETSVSFLIINKIHLQKPGLHNDYTNSRIILSKAEEENTQRNLTCRKTSMEIPFFFFLTYPSQSVYLSWHWSEQYSVQASEVTLRGDHSSRIIPLGHFRWHVGFHMPTSIHWPTHTDTSYILY